MGLSFAQYLSFLGVVSVAVGSTAEAGPSGTSALDGAKAVRFTADPDNSAAIFYKGGSNAADLDETASGDSSDVGIPLAAGANSGWLPGKPSDYYLAAASTQSVLIEVMG